MKKKLFTAIITAATLTLASCQPVSASENDYELDNIDNMYPLTGIVTNLKLNAKPGEDLVTITCANGNMFSWYAPTTDCWDLYDLASCIMDSNGTKYVNDDEVILAYYAGGLNQFEKLIKYN